MPPSLIRMVDEAFDLSFLPLFLERFWKTSGDQASCLLRRLRAAIFTTVCDSSRRPFLLVLFLYVLASSACFYMLLFRSCMLVKINMIFPRVSPLLSFLLRAMDRSPNDILNFYRFGYMPTGNKTEFMVYESMNYKNERIEE